MKKLCKEWLVVGSKLFFLPVFSIKRFPGYDAESGEFDASVHRDHIFGKHVSAYMVSLKSENEEAYRRQFSRYLKLGINADSVSKSMKCVALFYDQGVLQGSIG